MARMCRALSQSAKHTMAGSLPIERDHALTFHVTSALAESLSLFLLLSYARSTSGVPRRRPHAAVATSSSPTGVAAASPSSLAATSFTLPPSGGSLLADYLADPSRVSSQKQLAEVASAAAAVAAAAAAAAMARAPQQRQQRQWQSDSAVVWEPRGGLLYPAPQRQRQRPQQLNYSGPTFSQGCRR